MKKRTESEFSTFVLSVLKPILAKYDLLIEEYKNIMTDVTCVYEKNKFRLTHGFSETDIAIFKEESFDVRDIPNGIIRFYGDKVIKEGRLAIPYVVLELKTGNLTTDGIRTRDFVAARIRTLFPFAAYYFIAECTSKEEQTLLRQGKSFTNYFISQSEMTREDIKTIARTYIEPHLDNLFERFRNNIKRK